MVRLNPVCSFAGEKVDPEIPSPPQRRERRSYQKLRPSSLFPLFFPPHADRKMPRPDFFFYFRRRKIPPASPLSSSPFFAVQKIGNEPFFHEVEKGGVVEVFLSLTPFLFFLISIYEGCRRRCTPSPLGFSRAKRAALLSK